MSDSGKSAPVLIKWSDGRAPTAPEQRGRRVGRLDQLRGRPSGKERAEDGVHVQRRQSQRAQGGRDAGLCSPGPVTAAATPGSAHVFSPLFFFFESDFLVLNKSVTINNAFRIFSPDFLFFCSHLGG